MGERESAIDNEERGWFCFESKSKILLGWVGGSTVGAENAWFDYKTFNFLYFLNTQAEFDLATLITANEDGDH
jgi:hypothetical protein